MFDYLFVSFSNKSFEFNVFNADLYTYLFLGNNIYFNRFNYF